MFPLTFLDYCENEEVCDKKLKDDLSQIPKEDVTVQEKQRSSNPLEDDRGSYKGSELDFEVIIKHMFPNYDNIMNHKNKLQQLIRSQEQRKAKMPSSRWTKEKGYVALPSHSQGKKCPVALDAKRARLEKLAPTTKCNLEFL